MDSTTDLKSLLLRVSINEAIQLVQWVCIDKLFWLYLKTKANKLWLNVYKSWWFMDLCQIEPEVEVIKTCIDIIVDITKTSPFVLSMLPEFLKSKFNRFLTDFVLVDN